jgi:hypothetical protein
MQPKIENQSSGKINGDLEFVPDQNSLAHFRHCSHQGGRAWPAGSRPLLCQTA